MRKEKNSPEWDYSLFLMKSTKKSVFISGKAGTGKTTLIKEFVQNGTKKNYAIIAPTGLAASHFKGSTIHKFFGFRPIFQKESSIHTRNQEILKKLDLLIIDEISMVRVDIMDAVDKSLRINRGINLPFGGVQMVFVGDLFQLPPVVTEVDKPKIEKYFTGEFFFNAPVFQKFEYEFVELAKVFRQKDENFIGILNRIRENNILDNDIPQINKQVLPVHKTFFLPQSWWKKIIRKIGSIFGKDIFALEEKTEEIEIEKDIIKISSVRKVVIFSNLKRLSELSTEEKIFSSAFSGEWREKSIKEKWENLNIIDLDKLEIPLPYEVKLKKGAKIMMITNDKAERWFNGTMGEVLDFVIEKNGEGKEEEKIKVSLDGRIEFVEKYTAENCKYFVGKSGEIEKEVISSQVQFPIILAWAITIHKSQGMSFDKMLILNNGKKMFAHGQMYVALSRGRMLDNIFLQKPIETSEIILDERIVEFYKNLESVKI